jgi:asparaginyl-tRNA synthetase
MIEPEMAFSDLWNAMNNAESYVKYVVKYAMNVCRTDLEFFNSFVDKELLNRLVKLVDQPFQKVNTIIMIMIDMMMTMTIIIMMMKLMDS